MSHGVFWDPGVHWGIQIAIYLFLGGLAGGSYITGYVADLMSLRTESEIEYVSRRETARWGMYISVVSIAFGGVALILHLGRPLRALLFPILFTNFGSWMVIGTWVIVLFSLFAVFQAFWYTFGGEAVGETGMSLAWRRLLSKYVRVNPGTSGRSRLVRMIDQIADTTRPPRKAWLGFGAIGVLLSLVLVPYTAMLLSAVETIPLWDRMYLPLIFLLSGVSTGIAGATGLTIVFEGLSETVHVYSLADDVLIVIEILVLGALVASLDAAGFAGRVSQFLINGQYMPMFWGAIVAAGLVLPVIISLAITVLCHPGGVESLSDEVRDVAHAGMIVKYALVIQGGFFLRFIVLLAAVQLPYVPVGVPGVSA
ncbi:MAG: NrfD/PsrC family molybdoenzyme membrane anchor subunit [Halodesulfurarchaeum sp.]